MYQLKQFKIEELFNKKTVKGYPKKDENLEHNNNGYHIFGQNIKYQYPQKVLLNKKYLFEVDPLHPILAYASSTGSIGIIEESFYRSGDNGAFQALIPKSNKLNYHHLLYILTSLKKVFSRFNYASSIDNIPQLTINLPVNDQNQLALNYMEDHIKELEQERLKELEQDRVETINNYLIDNGLADYEISKPEKLIMSYSPHFKPFKLAKTYVKRGKTILVDEKGIFDIVPTKKKINANSISFRQSGYPYVARGKNKNGIKGYIDYDEKYLNKSNTISFGQDTATMNYQPERYFTGDKIQIFNLNADYGKLNDKIALYLITATRKAFSNFSWGQSSFALDKISKLDIYLPCDKKDNIDFEYMGNYIKAIQKLTIKNVVQYKDKVINKTKEVIDYK